MRFPFYNSYIVQQCTTHPPFKTENIAVSRADQWNAGTDHVHWSLPEMMINHWAREQLDQFNWIGQTNTIQPGTAVSRPQLIQLIPTVQITLFTSSFQGKFLKIRVTKVTCTCSFFMYMYIFPSFTTPRGIFGQKWPTSNTQKMTKNGKKRTSGNCGNTHSSTFHIERPFSRYGRSKLKFLCEQFSHCIYSFC